MDFFRLEYVRRNLRYLRLYHPMNNINVKIDDFIHGNDIITYNVAVMDNLDKFSVIITTYLEMEIIISIRMTIPK